MACLGFTYTHVQQRPIRDMNILRYSLCTSVCLITVVVVLMGHADATSFAVRVFGCHVCLISTGDSGFLRVQPSALLLPLPQVLQVLLALHLM